MKRAQVIEELEKKFKTIFNVSYNTNVPIPVMEKEMLPYLHEDIGFKDAWQEGRGIKGYVDGMHGFHSMFTFESEIYQVSVALDKDGKSGRAIVDGVMNIKPLKWFWVYALRVIIVYHFDVISIDNKEIKFVIRDHEEMWSFGDMIRSVPVIGYLYSFWFRRLFAYGFNLACRFFWRCQKLLGTDVATGKNWDGRELLVEVDLNGPKERARDNLWEYK
jgi:hypothetical protein